MKSLSDFSKPEVKVEIEKEYTDMLVIRISKNASEFRGVVFKMNKE